MTKELKTGIRGLSVVCSDDGVWLSTKSDSGKSLLLNLSNIAKEQGGIRGSALFEWCEQTAKESGWCPEGTLQLAQLALDRRVAHAYQVLTSFCVKWLGENGAWAKCIGVRFDDGVGSLSLFVVMLEEKHIELEHRRAVSTLGLMLSGETGFRIESRTVLARPDHCNTFIEWSASANE